MRRPRLMPKRMPKKHKPWCVVFLPSIGKCDCWYLDDDDNGKPRPRRPKPLAGGGAPVKREREMEDA